MYKIVLLNLPFTDTRVPSLALTQLKYVLDEEFGKRVATNIWYLDHDFTHYLGPNLSQGIIKSSYTHLATGLGDWFFRQTAFPSLPDNSAEYLHRFYPRLQRKAPWFQQLLLEKRRGLEPFFDELIEKYHLDQADLVGFTSTFSQSLACISLARKLKELRPDTVTVMGGANCETPMGEEIVKNVKAIDFVFSGPALISFPQFVEYRLEQDFESCQSIPGVFSQANCLPVLERIGARQGQILSGPIRHQESGAGMTLPAQVGPGTIGKERDINDTIELDYRSFLQSIRTHFPNKEVEPILLFETSRGCWWGERAHCTFCGMNSLGMNYRAMSPQNAITSLQSLFDYAEECSAFVSVDNILPRHYTQEVLPFLNTPSQASLFYEVKADLSEKDIRTLSQARVKTIQPGIEALATSTLKLMKKGTTAFQNIRFLKHCVTYEIFPLWNLLVGFPGEKGV